MLYQPMVLDFRFEPFKFLKIQLFNEERFFTLLASFNTLRFRHSERYLRILFALIFLG